MGYLRTICVRPRTQIYQEEKGDLRIIWICGLARAHAKGGPAWLA